MSNDVTIPNSVTQITNNLFIGGIRDDKSSFDYVISCTFDSFVIGMENQINIHAPFHDCDDLPKEEYLNKIVDSVVDALNKNQKVLVHCTAGLNRSALVCVLVLMKMSKITAKAAITHLRRFRSPDVLFNKTFFNYLIEKDKQN